MGYGKLSTFMGVLALILQGNTAQAQATNYWSNADSGTWLWNDAANWTPGIPTSTTTRVYWTNNAASAYTVKLTGPATSGLIRVTNDKVIFDLNGYRWDAPDSGVASDYGGSNPAVSHWLGGDVGEACEVIFSGSADGENLIKLDSGLQHGWRWGNGTDASIIQITTNLGYGVVVLVPPNGGPNGARITIRGPGSELRNPAANYATVTKGNIQVVDGGYLNFGSCYSASLTGNITVDQARMHVFSRNGATAIGGVQVGQVVLTNQAVWVSANTLQIGNNLAKGSLIVDDSTFIGKNITLGKGTRHGETVVRNNGRLVLTNGYIYVNSGPSTVLTNLLVLDNGTIDMATTTAGCAVTNAGLMRASGTIRCVGAEPAVVCNLNRMEIDAGQGLLNLTNAILENAASGTLAFGFRADGSDTIWIDDGTATIGGTSCFSTVSFTPQRGADQRWNFVEADSIVYSASDNMDALMGSFGLVADSDYTFGVKAIGERQALQLWIKPPGGSLILIR